MESLTKEMRALENEIWPEKQRFRVSFMSRHLTDKGSWISQNQRRWWLCDTANQAIDATMKELTAWNRQFHRFENLHSEHCPTANPYPSYSRFTRIISKP